MGEQNHPKLKRAFDDFRLPQFDMTLKNFLDVEKFDVFRFGRIPVAIDIITDIKGLVFDSSWKQIERKNFGGVMINYISYNDLILAKEASGRPRDINDIENLKSKKKK